ncbi:MAG: J domain-containing protein [Fimbriimonadales bacterium]
MGRRITRLMKAHWGELVERVEQVIREETAESTAAQELQDALDPTRAPSAPAAPKPSAQETALSRAYRVLGLPDGAELAEVRRAYRELMARSDPSRFPEGSPERARAEHIRQRIEQAYQTLLLHLDHTAQRFRNLQTD